MTGSESLSKHENPSITIKIEGCASSILSLYGRSRNRTPRRKHKGESAAHDTHRCKSTKTGEKDNSLLCSAFHAQSDTDRHTHMRRREVKRVGTVCVVHVAAPMHEFYPHQHKAQGSLSQLAATTHSIPFLSDPIHHTTPFQSTPHLYTQRPQDKMLPATRYNIAQQPPDGSPAAATTCCSTLPSPAAPPPDTISAPSIGPPSIPCVTLNGGGAAAAFEGSRVANSAAATAR